MISSASAFGKLVSYDIGGGWGSEVEKPGSIDPAYVIRGTDIPRVIKGDLSTVPLRFHAASNLKSRALKSNDIIFEVSGGSKGQPVGRAVIVTERLLADFPQPVMCASFCKLIRIDNAKAHPGFVYRVLQAAYADGRLDAYQVQSTGITNFKWKPFLEHFELTLPDRDVQIRAATALDAIDALIANLGREIGTLAQIRDGLVPKLVSGKIDVSRLDLDALLDGAVA